MRGEEAVAAGEVLLRRLRRLVSRASAVDRRDRNQLIALLDEFETVRRDLRRECAEIEAEMRQASVRTTAIGTYLRNLHAGRGTRNN
jgi:hypothetical protein